MNFLYPFSQSVVVPGFINYHTFSNKLTAVILITVLSNRSLSTSLHETRSCSVVGLSYVGQLYGMRLPCSRMNHCRGASTAHHPLYLLSKVLVYQGVHKWVGSRTEQDHGVNNGVYAFIKAVR